MLVIDTNTTVDVYLYAAVTNLQNKPLAIMVRLQKCILWNVPYQFYCDYLNEYASRNNLKVSFKASPLNELRAFKYLFILDSLGGNNYGPFSS